MGVDRPDSSTNSAVNNGLLTKQDHVSSAPSATVMRLVFSIVRVGLFAYKGDAMVASLRTKAGYSNVLILYALVEFVPYSIRYS